LIVLFDGLVWLELAWLEWLVFGLVAGFFGGLVLLALGVRAFKALVVEGLMVSLLLGAWVGRLTEYGPAVAGLVISGRGRNLVGRIGATDRPPWATVVDSGRGRTGPESPPVDMVEVAEEDDTVRMGENVDIAEPGLAGRFLFASTAFFWASMVSLREGFGGPDVLLEKPNPGRATTPSGFFGELGLSGAISNNLCCAVSSVAIILSKLAGIHLTFRRVLTLQLSQAKSKQMPSTLIS
jgi:hypothetical protein